LAKSLAHRIPSRIAAGDSVAVIGLGRFGSAVAVSLEEAGVEVLGVDNDPRLVAEYSDRLTFAAQADSTSVEALRQLAIPSFDRAVLGIGSNLEASILTAAHLVEFGIPSLWAKALSDDHARILRLLGVTNVIRPEIEVGRQLAQNLLGGAGQVGGTTGLVP
jgi:trk system potassium uptake protein TrkA